MATKPKFPPVKPGDKPAKPVKPEKMPPKKPGC